MKKIFILLAFLVFTVSFCSQSEELTQPLASSDLSSLGGFSFNDTGFLSKDQKDFILNLKRMTEFKLLTSPKKKMVRYITLPHNHHTQSYTEYIGEGFFSIDRTTIQTNFFITAGYLQSLQRQERALNNKSDIRLVNSAIAIIDLIEQQQSKGYIRCYRRSPNPYEVELMEKNVGIVTNSAWRKLIKVKDKYLSYGTLEKFAIALAHLEFKKYYKLSREWSFKFSDSFKDTVERMSCLEQKIIKEAIKNFRKRKRDS